MWIPRQTATRLTIWRTSNTLFSKIGRGWFMLLVLAAFFVLAGYWESISCSRSDSSAPIQCEVIQGNILGSEVLVLTDVRDAHVTDCGKGSTCAAIEHMGGETLVPNLDPVRVVGLVSRYVFMGATRSQEISVDMRPLGVLGLLIVVVGGIGWLWYSVSDYEWSMIDLNKDRDCVTIRRQVLFHRPRFEERHLSAITAVRCRQRHETAAFPQVQLLLPGRDLFLWEDIEAASMADRIRIFLDLSE